MFLSGKRGQAFVFLLGLLFLFFVGLLFIVLDQGFSSLQNSTLTVGISGSVYEDTFDKGVTIWDLFLVICSLGVFLFMLVTALRSRGEGVV